MIARLLLFVVLAAFARGAAYEPGAAAKIDWTPNINSGVGVPGGIPARSTVHSTLTSTGDTTDRAHDIMLAIHNCPEGQTVLLGPGVFYISWVRFRSQTSFYNGIDPSGGFEFVNISNRTLRGSGTGAGGTTIRTATGGVGITALGGSSSGASVGGVITGSPTKGATTLSATNAGTATVGRLMLLSMEDDLTLPVISTRGYQYLKGQLVRITAVDGGAGTITFQPPLYQTPVEYVGGAALEMRWGEQAGNPTLVGAGFEDFISDINAVYSFGISINGAHGSWVKGVKVINPKNYGITFGESSQCEIRDCWIDKNNTDDWTQGNRAGLNIGTLSACLIENNVIIKNFPLIESQGGFFSGNVIGYNFGLQFINNVAFSSHSTGDYCNLWEGNSTTNITQDGYFGGTSYNVVYRNDLHGVVKDSAQPHWPIQINRFGRKWEIVGNQLGRSGTTLNYELGRPNAFNGNVNGEANNLTGDPQVDLGLVGTLTRIADNHYTVVMSTTLGQLVVDQWPISITPWPRSWGDPHRVGQAISAINVGTMTVTLVDGGPSGWPASGGSVFSSGTTVFLWPGENSSFQEWDNAVAYTTTLLGNFQYKTSGLDVSLGTTTLPASLYRSSAPPFMSGYNWPPYDPNSPDPRHDAIPAGARYLAEENTVASPSFSPAAGAYASSQSVTITCATSGATIYYTTDGTTPTTSSSVYSSALTIAVSPATTLKAFAVKAGMTDSGVTSGTYSQTAGSATPGYSPTRTFFRRR